MKASYVILLIANYKLSPYSNPYRITIPPKAEEYLTFQGNVAHHYI